MGTQIYEHCDNSSTMVKLFKIYSWTSCIFSDYQANLRPTWDFNLDVEGIMNKVGWVTLTDRVISRDNIFEVAHTNLNKEAEGLIFCSPNFPETSHLYLVWYNLICFSLISTHLTYALFHVYIVFQQVSLEWSLWAQWMLQRILTEFRVLVSGCL